MLTGSYKCSSLIQLKNSPLEVLLSAKEKNDTLHTTTTTKLQRPGGGPGAGGVGILIGF